MADAQAARGQNRTVQRDWKKVAPYIKFRYERAAERLPAPNTPVYELGCGIGVGLNFLARSRIDLEFIGFDNSSPAVDLGTESFQKTPNLRLVHTTDLAAVEANLALGSFLVAFEVIEHLNDSELLFFKERILGRVDEAVFSFPYNQKELEGTNHLQTIDIYTIFEMFPGFETVFLRRGSMKFIGYWKRRNRGYVATALGIRGERKAVNNIFNYTINQPAGSRQ